ncbi:MAG: hypothetical protein NC342_04120 [Pseudoflavonifractor sp.]|nr:hypothetical protein [Alloprevotella sp.]MCM1116702.1 hypothetical protein [Pseudoflavonifractor sp.]
MMTTLSHPAEITVDATAPSRPYDRLFPLAEDSSELTVTCRRGDYSASAIARAVEDSDSHLINLNVTSDYDTVDGGDTIVVELRINRRDPWPAARSLERYGYEVTDTRTAMGDKLPDDLALDRLRSLIRRLEV